MTAGPRDLTGAPVPRASSPQPTSPREHVGWRSRGYLPHFDSPGAVQHIVFRLADALPARILQEVEKASPVERTHQVLAALRVGYGQRLLADLGPPAAAQHTESALPSPGTEVAAPVRLDEQVGPETGE